VVAAILVAGCTSRKPKPQPAAPPEAEEEKPALPEHVRLGGGDFVLTAPEGGRLWQGSGKSFDWDTQAQTAVLTDAKGTFFEAGKPALEGAASRIRVDTKARVVYLDEGVQASSPVTGAAFSADRAEWRADEQKVYGQGNVKVVRGQSEASADRLVADTALKRVRLEGEGRPVTLRIVQTPGKALW